MIINDKFQNLLCIWHTDYVRKQSGSCHLDTVKSIKRIIYVLYAFMGREEISEPSPPTAPQNYIIIPFAIEANRVA